MKAFVCFALFAVAAAIPLQDQVVVIPDGPVPIPFDLLRGPMPVWRDLPQAPEGVLIVPIPDRMLRDFDNSIKISEVHFVNDEPIPENAESVAEIIPESVQVVNAFIPTNEEQEIAAEVLPEPVNVVDTLELANEEPEIAAEIVPEPVNVVESLEPVADILAPELSAAEDAEMRFVKFVDSPATFDLKNVKVPIDAHDIV